MPVAQLEGRRIHVSGTVQGVGFRPWVYRVARQAGVTGRVRNDSSGVTIDAFGDETALAHFLDALHWPPPAARIVALRSHRHRARTGGRVRDRRQRARRRPTGLDSAGPGDLRRLSVRDLRPRQSPLPLRVHELHELRAAVHHRHGHSLRPPRDHDGAGSRCVRPAAASTPTSPIGGSTRSRTRVRPAVRSSACAPRTVRVSTLTM